MTRRTFLGSASGALAAPKAEPFRYRGYLGWITDLATEPEPHTAWPSIRLDDGLARDYHRTFELMRQWQLKELCVWGLQISRAWPLRLKDSVTPERARAVARLLEDAHAHGIRVLSGLGIYSWGFDGILKVNPHLMKGNRSTMCGSEEESWEWMRRVIDYIFSFPIDGVSMQSADQGRCPCDKCGRYTETEYHARLNIRCADYIRAKYPGKLIGVSGWGMRFHDPASLPHLKALGSHIDYLIDVRDSSRQNDPGLRRRLIAEIPCAFGTLGGPQVEPPQHWARERWFLPTIRAVGEHLQALHSDGGRACEWFYHILANPGDEISTWVAAKLLADPATGWRAHLDASLERLYNVKAKTTRDALAEAFLAAENAYIRHIPGFCGTVSLEPLVSSEPGPPVYLTKRLNAGQRAAYGKDLAAARTRFEQLLPDVPEKRRMQSILRAIDNVRADLSAITE